MSGYDPAAYGDRLGDRYDAMYSAADLETDPAVELLDALAGEVGERSFMELGIGTGRLALPLAQRGFRVGGVDASEAMIRTLRAKPGGKEVTIALGDYADTRVQGRYAVAAMVFNNILDSRGRATQIEIFRNAAAHLRPGGLFVVEAFVLTEAQRSGEWTVLPRFVGDEHVELQVARFDVVSGRLERTLIRLRPDGNEFVRFADVYAAPGELDTMAEVAGFELRARYANWARADYTASSARHVSVYRLR